MLQLEIEDERIIKTVKEFAEAQKVSPERFVLRLVERGVNVKDETLDGREDRGAHSEAVGNSEESELPEVSCAVSG